MRNIAVVSPNLGSSCMAEFASAISAAGFRVKHFKVSAGKSEVAFTVEELEECSAVIAEIQETNLALFLHLSYLIGRGKNVWIVSEDADKLPEVLKKASFISSKASDKCDLIIKQIRERLNIETPLFETVGDFTSLISWIREEPNRIAGLSSKDFETFVLLLLSEIGLNREADLSASSGDLIFSDPATHTIFLVESKNYVSGRKIGVGEIERSVANAMNLSCDFAVLVSANEFTRSAVEYAKLCAPPVWLIGRENLESLISSDPKSAPKVKERFKSLFKWIMGERDNVPDSGQSHKYYFNERALLIDSGDDSPHGLEIPLNVFMKRKLLKNRPKFNFVEYVPCEVFVSFGEQEKSEEISQQILQFLNELDSWGIVVWHDSPAFHVGNQCLKLPDVASAVKRSDVMLYFLEQNIHQSMQSMKTLQTLALELSKSKQHEIITCVIGNDNPWNRLKLPSMFSESIFLHPYESEWKTIVLNLCQQLIKLQESSLRPTQAAKGQGRRYTGNMNGERYLGDKNTTEVHDLDNEKPFCQIDEIIKAGHDHPYDSLSDANSAEYDNCAYCIGGSAR